MAKFSSEVRLSREMSLLDVTLIGVGAMIGAGIFVLTGIAAGVAGPALILVFALNGLIALLTAMSYAELGSCYHDAGGGYLWVKEGLPRWNGFLSGWMSWFAHAVACSLYALGFAAYFEHLLSTSGLSMPHWGFLSPQKLLAALVAVLFAYINFRGASETGKIGNLITISKFFILAFLVGFGLQFLWGRPDWREPFTPFMPNGWGGVVKAMGLTFIAFQGFEVISQCSEEVQAPRKNIPRAIMLSLLIVVPIYLLVAVTALGSVNPGTMTPWDYLALNKETALVNVAQQFFVGGGFMLLLGGLVSTMSALNATVYSSSRVAFAMGRDRNFPELFSRVDSTKHTPHWAILFSLCIVVFMAVYLPIEDVAASADIMFLLLFLQVNLAMIRLRRMRPELDRGFVTPLFPYLSILGIGLLLSLALYMFAYSPKAWIVTACWVAAGLVVYKSYASKRDVEHVRKTRALSRLERQEYRILVCISNPATVPSLTHVATAIAKKNKAEILFLHVIEVEEGAPLAAGIREVDHLMPLFEAAEQQVTEAGIRARSMTAVAHRISQGIVDTAESEDCNLIILNREKESSFLERYGSTVLHAVIHEAPAEVLFLHGEIPKEGVRRILLPFGENIHTRLAVELAPALVEYYGSDLSILVVFPPDIAPAERRERIRIVEELVHKSCPAARVEVMEESDVVRGVLHHAHQADLLLMGGRSGSLLEMLVASSVTEDITRQTTCPVVWVEEYEESESMLTHLFGPSAPDAGRDGHGV